MKKTILPLLWIGAIAISYPSYAANYSQELQDAYSWAYWKSITTQPSIERANMDWAITRAEMAKMISNYAKNVLGETPDTSANCSFNDISWIDESLKTAVIESCQLGLMGQWISNFRPNDSVTRAEFGTVLSRALWGEKNNNGWSTYYENHLKALQEAWIMNNISTPSSNEIRGYVMLMMQRSSDNKSGNQEPPMMPNGSGNQMGMPWDMNGNQPPEKPNGEQWTGWMWQPPMMPNGSGNQMGIPWGMNWNQPPEKPDGNGGMPWGMWNQSNSVTYSWANVISSTTTASNKTYSSTTSSQNALLVEGWSSTLTNITVNKSWDSDWWDSADFYGTNAAVLAKAWNITIKDSNITSNATHGNAVFAYWEGSIVISDSTITTKKDTSWGIMVTWGWKLTANNLTVTTQGNSSAPIRSDRWGGTLIVNWGNYTSNGVWSPAIYSTADITVNNATLTSNVSEGVVVEGKNSVSLNNVNLVANNTKLNGQSTTYKTIFLYQSVSWDAEEGTAEFTAKDSKITTKKGDTFYVTNTSAKISLENNTITNSVWDFLRIESWAWWKSGSNWGDVILSLSNQDVDWDIIVDSISKLKMSITNGSDYVGAINTANASKNITVSLDANSTWTLTADSYISSLDNAVSDNSNINLNGYKLTIGN